MAGIVNQDSGLGEFHNVLKGRIMATTTTKASTAKSNSALLLCKLAALFGKAKAAALAADPGDGFAADGGTCNLDSPAFRIDRCRGDLIAEAAEAAGVSVNDFTWFGGRKWFWLNVPMNGQADRRHKMARAAAAVLREAADSGEIPGMSACLYCQMD